ncbi:hypothetical protein ACLOJK_005603, partial [Asimina triloba]
CLKQHRSSPWQTSSSSSTGSSGGRRAAHPPWRTAPAASASHLPSKPSPFNINGQDPCDPTLASSYAQIQMGRNPSRHPHAVRRQQIGHPSAPSAHPSSTPDPAGATPDVSSATARWGSNHHLPYHLSSSDLAGKITLRRDRLLLKSSSV